MTRDAILGAARSSFAAVGYHASTIRSIAATAAVDPALVHHYFGTKEDLFAACIELPFSPGEVAAAVFGDGPPGAGERVTALFFSAWEAPASREALLAMLRGAFAGDHGADAMREFVESVLLIPIAHGLGGEGAERRVAAAAAQLIGVAVLRHVVRLEPLASDDIEDIARVVAPHVDGYLSR